MNRLSFLKTISVGIAAAVIAPKVIAEAIEAPKPKDKEWCLRWAEEAYQRSLKPKPYIGDIVIDRDGRQWLVTAVYLGKVEVKAFEADPLPNFLDVDVEHFDEYFVVCGSAFMQGTGQPI